ncbi:MAG TPA: helix-turn-helix domain-containing protein, partial [Vulgatibacter sp.]
AGSTEGIAEGRIYAEVLERAERRILELALSRSGGNQVQAARWLGIHRNTLRARLQALGLSPTDG